MTSISGSRILITGAASGFGRLMALQMSKRGAKMVLWDINKEGLTSIKKEIESQGNLVETMICDLRDREEINSCAIEVLKSGPIDILVNNAGNNIPEHFTKVKTKNMEYLVRVNTIATFNIAQLCAIKMMKLKNRKKVGGSIINMSSQMGHVGGPIRSVYNMNKWGLEGLTKGMAVDLAKYNIRVNAVAPTFVVTPMTKKFLKNKKFKKETLNNIPLGRFAEMSEIASTVVFLASDAASMIHGTVSYTHLTLPTNREV